MSASGAGEDHGATNSDGVERISVPVREFIERDELHRTAVFEVCDQAVSAFEVDVGRTHPARVMRSKQVL